MKWNNVKSEMVPVGLLFPVLAKYWKQPSTLCTLCSLSSVSLMSIVVNGRCFLIPIEVQYVSNQK